MPNAPKLYLQTELEFEAYLCELGELPEAVKGLIRQSRSDQLQLEEQNQELRQRLRLLETVIFQAQDGVMITEAEQDTKPSLRILYVNEAFSRMTGYSSEEVIGQTPRILQGPETDQQVLAQVHQALAQHQPVRAEVINYRKDGSPFWMAFEVSPVFDQEGDCSHFFATQRDVTEHKQIEQELRQHQDHLDELVRERTAELAWINERLTQEIAERERVEEALRQNETRYTLAQRAANVGLWERELTSNKLYWSEQTEAIFGFEPGTFPGTLEAFLACVHPEDRESLRAANKASLLEGREYIFEHRIIRLDGTMRWVLEQGNAIRDVQDQPVRFVGVVQDISDRKEAAEALRQAYTEERYLRQVADSLREVATILNRSLDQEDILAQIFEQLGRVVRHDGGAIFLVDGDALLLFKGFGRIAQRHQGERIPLSSHNPVARAFHSKDVLLINEGGQETHWMDWPGKHPIYAWVGAPLIVDQLVIGLLTVDRYTPGDPYTPEDIQLLQAFVNQAALAIRNARLYEALQASEARFRTISELTSDYAYSVRVEPDQTRTLEWGTPLFTGIIGHSLTPEERERVRGIEIYPEDQPLVQRRLERLLANREDVSEYRIVTKSGEIRWLRDYSRSVWDEAAGRVIRIIGAAQDITERKQAVQALSESEKRYRLLAEYSLDGIALIEEGRLVYVSPAYGQVHGYSPEQILGMDFETIMGLVHPDDRERISRLVDHSKPVQKYSFRFKHQDGHYAWVEDVVRRIFDRQGRLLQTIISSREIGERKALEEQLYQSQKMEALGRLAGGVAHHFNNTLTAIIGFIELAMANLPVYYPAVQDLEQAHASAMKAASMTHQLLAFTRRQVVQSRLFNINTLVTQGQALLARLIPVSVILVTDLAPDAGQIKIDRSQFEQLLVNLVVNGCEAMADGGQLTIETASITLTEAEEAPGPELPAGPYARLTIQDTGVGMSEAVQGRIFEPFFTTKEVGQGTGLGLSTCYGIVKQHGGDIRVESRVGQGTSVYVYLPQVGTSE